MSLRLETSVGTPLVRAALALALTVALTAAMLALSPAAAEAQTSAQTEDRRAPAVVVRPGDSLWSISEGRLGPNASPRRVMKGAERIHALNRDRIGADPDLIFVGQELSLPPAMSGPPNGATVPARKAAEASGSEASGSGPRVRAAKGPAGKEAPRKASGQGAIPRSDISLEEDAEMLGADTAGKEALPEPRAAAPVPAVRMVASKDAQPGSFFGVPADARAEGRLLLGLGIMALVAALVAAYVRGAARRKAKKRELWFRETYGRPYAASEPFASQEEASRRVSGVRGQAAPSDGPTNAGAASKDRSERTDPSVVAWAKRARVRRERPLGVRRQSPRLRARGLRQPVRTRSQRRAFSGRPRMKARARRTEWEPSAALVGALKGLPLRPGTGQGEDLAKLKPLLGEAFRAMGRLERQRGLSEREAKRREALRAFMAAIKRAE